MHVVIALDRNRMISRIWASLAELLDLSAGEEKKSCQRSKIVIISRSLS